MPTIIIYWSPVRSAEQKAAVVQGITDTMVAHGMAKPEDVVIIFQNIEPGDSARAGKPIVPPKAHSHEPPAQHDPDAPTLYPEHGGDSRA